MSTINGKVCVVDGVAVDKVFSDGKQVYARNLYLNSKAIKDAYSINVGSKVTVEPFDSTTNMWHIVAKQGTGDNIGIYFANYATDKLPDISDWSYSADVKGTGAIVNFGIEGGRKKPVIGTIGSEWSRIVQTGHLDNAKVKTLIMYFNTTSSPLDVYIKLPKLETGKMPTPWTPAPEDVLKGAITAPNNLVESQINATTKKLDWK